MCYSFVDIEMALLKVCKPVAILCIPTGFHDAANILSKYPKGRSDHKISFVV